MLTGFLIICRDKIIKVVYWGHLFCGFRCSSVPAIRCPRHTLREGLLNGVSVDSLPYHVEMSTLIPVSGLWRVYWCGERIAGTFINFEV